MIINALEVIHIHISFDAPLFSLMSRIWKIITNCRNLACWDYKRLFSWFLTRGSKVVLLMKSAHWRVIKEGQWLLTRKLHRHFANQRRSILCGCLHRCCGMLKSCHLIVTSWARTSLMVNVCATVLSGDLPTYLSWSDLWCYRRAKVVHYAAILPAARVWIVYYLH